LVVRIIEKGFLCSVLEYLDEVEVPYVLTPTLVRGLDYYTDTVFEFIEDGVEGGSTRIARWGVDDLTD
jgi:histidyl-tRNA synthetase